ncbi:MAG: tetratricopeptide repeat protein [Phycisphaerae bacterium]|nr:tetratricopeptide repeat protein [Phycisphaerae bacterium]
MTHSQCFYRYISFAAAPRHTRLPASILLVCFLVAAGAGAQDNTPSALAAAPLDLDPLKAAVSLAELQTAPDGPVLAAQEGAAPPEVREHYKTALELMEDGEFELAVEELNAALALAEGDCFDLLYLLAEAKRRLGRFGEARSAAELAGLYRPGNHEVHGLLGRLYREQGRWEAAIRHFRSATLAADWEPEDPRAATAWYELGECLEESGYLLAAAEAFEHFDRMLWETHPQYRSDKEVAPILAQHPHGTIARRLELLRRLDLAEGSAGTEPGRYIVWHRLPAGGTAGTGPGRYINGSAERARVAKWAVESRPDEPYLQRLYVRTLLDIGQAAEAFEFCRERLAASEADDVSEPAGTEPGRYIEGSAGTGPGRYSGSALLTLTIEAARAADRFDGWVARLQEDLARGEQVKFATRLARRLDESGSHELSVPLWRALSARQPAAADTAWALASALKATGDLPGALDSLIEFVRRTAHDAEAAGEASRTIPAERLEEWMRSFEVTDEFLNLVTERTGRDECDFATYTVLGTTAAAGGQTELAERLFSAALEARPDFALARIAWGRMELASYHWDQARAQAERALAVAPNPAAAHLLLAQAHDGLDEHEEAEEAYKAALERRPDDVSYVLALARHYRRLGNLLAAQRYLQQAWSLERTRGDALEDLVDSYLEGGKLVIARGCLEEAETSDLPGDVLRRIRTTLRYAEKPMGAEHLAELAAQFDEFPDDTRTGLKLAAGLYLDDQADRALEVLKRVQVHDPDDERGMYLMSRIRLRRLEVPAAIAILEETARRYPRRLNTLGQLSEVYLTDFRKAEARETLRRILTLDLEPRQRQRQRAQLLSTYLEFMEFDAALELVEEWIAEEPDHDVWPRAKMQVLLLAERGQEAVELARARLAPSTELFEELLERYQALAERLSEKPDDSGLQARLQGLERELGACMEELFARRETFIEVCSKARRWEPAEREVRAWLAEQPGNPRLQEWLIKLLLASGEVDEALERLGEYIPRTPEDIELVLTLRARCYAAGEHLDKALGDLTKLLNEPFIRTDSAATARVRYQIIMLLIDGQDEQRAVTLCDEWLAGGNVDDRGLQFGVLSLKRIALLSAEREDEHIAVTEQVLELQPRDSGLNNDLGYSWADRGENLDRALEMIKLAVAVEPLNPAYLDSLGWAYYKLGDYDDARLYLLRSVQLREGQDAVVFDHLGDAEYRLGDHGAARRDWRKALAILEDLELAERAARQTELMAVLRGKLSALDQSETPPVAPLAAEQQREERP